MAGTRGIPIIEVTATNRCSFEIQLMLGSAKLTSSGTGYPAESSPIDADTAFRQLSWRLGDWEPGDWGWWPALDPAGCLTAVVPSVLLFGLIGWLCDRRRRRDLTSLADGELRLSPGETRSALIAFPAIPRHQLDGLTIPLRRPDAEPEAIEYSFRLAPGGDDVSKDSRTRRLWTAAPLD